MSSLELLGGKAAVGEFTERLAMERGIAAAALTRRQLKEFVGEGPNDLTEDQVEASAAKKRAEAETKFREERAAGLHNNEYSLGAGLTALVRQTAAGKIAEWLQTRNEQPSLFEGMTLEEVGQVGDEGLFVLRFPSGAYRTTSNSIFLYPEAQVTSLGDIFTPDGKPPTREQEIPLSRFGSIIRIEGDSGEFWQDPYSLPTGERREPSQPATS